MQCQECNHFRIHGETLLETQIRKNKEYQKRAAEKAAKKPPTPPKKTYTLKQSTSKQSSLNQKLAEVKAEIEMEAIQNDLYFCQGCGSSRGGLDKSHILSIKQRKDLELVKENIDLLCRSCHESWESKNAIRLLKLDCLERYLEYIENEDREALVKLIIIIDDFLISLPDTFDLELEEIVRKAIYLSKKFN